MSLEKGLRGFCPTDVRGSNSRVEKGAEDLNARERIAYLRGLLDCMEPEERNTKVYTAVAEALDALSLLELADMLDHHIRVEGVRVVVVELGALLETEIIVRLVVEVVAERRDVLIDKGLLELAHEG